jgi:CubicO group peptidase (beta-lactamase class C family)
MTVQHMIPVDDLDADSQNRIPSSHRDHATIYHHRMSKGFPIARAARLASGFLASCLITAPAPASAQGSAFAQRFDAVLAQHGVVGGGIAIVHMQEPATLRFFGKASKDTQQSIDAETSYNWASITKTMTAIAILQLRDRGKLSLDDSAVHYVPELRQVHDEFGSIDAITIRDLLTHSAGFRNPTWLGLR